MMHRFARSTWGRLIGFYLCVGLFAPAALAQHVAKSIQDAARSAGLLLDNEYDYDAKLKTLVMAFDPASPLDALQKLASFAKTAPVGANGRGDISVQQLCQFYEKLKSDPAFINSANWKSFQAGHGRFLDHLLYNGNSYCGAGPIQSLVVQNAPDGRYVWINLKDKINYDFPGGNFSTRTKQVRYRVSDNPEHAAQLMSDYSARGTNFNQLFQKIHSNRVLQNQDAQEVATAMTHVQEGTFENDRAKVVRTLATYDTLTLQPINKDDYLLFRPKGNQYTQMEIGAISMIAPHALADKEHGGKDVPFRKGVAVMRSYEYNGKHAIDGRVAQVSMPAARNNVAAEWKPVVDGTLAAVNTTMDNHFDAIQNSGIGLMYGPKSDFAKMTPGQQAAYIAQNRKPGTAPPVPVETSCIGFVLKNLEAGYKNAGKAERWKEIDQIVRDNAGDGDFLLQELKKDGWTTVYWNPDVKNPTTQVLSPSKPNDHHIWTASEVKKGKNYLSGVKLPNGEKFTGIPIDEKMLDYRPTNPYKTTAQTEQLQKLRDAPLFVGIANGGYHVYLGSQGQVIESHSTRGPTDPTNIEIRPFTEWGLLQGEAYLSGVIAVPPGGWGQK
jgi:hypothetical protein